MLDVEFPEPFRSLMRGMAGMLDFGNLIDATCAGLGAFMYRWSVTVVHLVVPASTLIVVLVDYLLPKGGKDKQDRVTDASANVCCDILFVSLCVQHAVHYLHL